MADRPNILFVFPDQFRADCIGRDPQSLRGPDGHAIVETPNLNHLVDTGVQFTRGYTPAPTCIPARRCLWTGQTPATSGSTKWVTDEWAFEHSLPRMLSTAGYQTHLIGKTHSQPERREFGFDHMELHTGLSAWDRSEMTDDYTEWLEGQVDSATEVSHGLSRNTIDGRPWHLEERLHPTHWTTTRAVRFLNTRDGSRPFFLTLGYVRPHQQWDPPAPYYDMYIDRDLPDAAVGDWVDDVYGDTRPAYITSDARGVTPNPWCAELSADRFRRARAAYYGLVTQIDHQLRRVTKTLELQGELENTLILVASDHGEMLGDHHLWFKSYGYEGSARVPFILRPHRTLGDPVRSRVDRPVGLEDVMPTLLDAAGVTIPESVEGRSLLRLLEDPDRDDWRSTYHGEHGPAYGPENAMQYLVDESTKYLWNPVTGDELLFDLDVDPRETRNLATDPEADATIERFRTRLIERLDGRPEGFTDGDALLAGNADYENTP